MFARTPPATFANPFNPNRKRTDSGAVPCPPAKTVPIPSGMVISTIQDRKYAERTSIFCSCEMLCGIGIARFSITPGKRSRPSLRAALEWFS
jgi:hypothetical protein